MKRQPLSSSYIYHVGILQRILFISLWLLTTSLFNVQASLSTTLNEPTNTTNSFDSSSIINGLLNNSTTTSSTPASSVPSSSTTTLIQGLTSSDSTTINSLQSLDTLREQEAQQAAERLAQDQSNHPRALSGKTLLQTMLTQKNSGFTKAQIQSAAFRSHTSLTVSDQELQTHPQTAGALQITRKTMATFPPAMPMVTNKTGMSFTRSNPTLVISKSLSSIDTQGLTTFIASLNESPTFLPIFKKLHIVILCQIYEYLMGIYSALNMTHINDLATYISLEKVYALNKKTLIINHLVNLVEAQLNQALLALFPKMPKTLVYQNGMSSLNSDGTSRIDLMVVNMEQLVFSIFGIIGIWPDNWQLVLTALENPEYTSLVAQENKTEVNSIITKLKNYIPIAQQIFTQQTQEAENKNQHYTIHLPSLLKKPSASELKSYKASLTSADISTITENVLTKPERLLLINTLDAITNFQNHFATITALKSIVTKITNSSKTSSAHLTDTEYTLLFNVIQPLLAHGPITKEITIITHLQQQLATMITQPAPTKLTLVQQKKLKLFQPLLGLMDSTDTTLMQNVLSNLISQPPETLQTIADALASVMLPYEKGLAQLMHDKLKTVLTALAPQLDYLSTSEKNLLPQLYDLSAFEKFNLQEVAQNLIEGKLQLSNLKKTPLTILTQGFTSAAAQATPNAPLYQAIAQHLQKGPVFTQAEATNGTESIGGITGYVLTPPQNNAYLQALTVFSQFTMPDITAEEAEQELYALCAQINPKVAGKITFVACMQKAFPTSPASPDLSAHVALDTLSSTDLLILGMTYQKMGTAMVSRIINHKSQAFAFESIIEQEPNLETIIFNAIQGKTFWGLYYFATIIDYLLAPPNARLLQTPIDVTALEKVSPADILTAVHSILQKLVNPSTASTSRNAGILQKIIAHYPLSTNLNDTLNTITSTTMPLLESVGKKINNPTFELSQLNAQEKSFLHTILSRYVQSTLAETPANPGTDNATKSALHQPTETVGDDANTIVLTSISSIIHAYNSYQSLQDSFINSLAEYLTFFTTYTETLKVKTSAATTGSVLDAYNGLTEFAVKAKAIVDTHDDILDQNPPLFLYNEDALRSIQIIPLLASEIEGTERVLYPTHAVDCALSTDPTSSNPLLNNQILMSDGTPLQNIPSLTITADGTTFSPKFFFRDVAGNIMANGYSQQGGSKLVPFAATPTQRTTSAIGTLFKNSAIPWLEQKIVLTSDHQNASYIYQPTQEIQGQEGLYMNIPVTFNDPLHKESVYIRLFEQKLIPQPDWLNYEDGIITMMRVCLGDWATVFTSPSNPSFSLPTSAIFDPCVTLIITQALIAAGKEHPFTPEELAHLEEQCRISLIQEYVTAHEQTSSVAVTQQPASKTQSSSLISNNTTSLTAPPNNPTQSAASITEGLL